MNNMKTEPVSPSAYNESWIKEAWGQDGIEQFIQACGSNIRPRVQAALKMVELNAGDCVLDVACGRGEVVFHAVRHGADATGIDFSPDVLQIAGAVHRRLAPEEAARCRFVQGDVTARLPFDAGSFDYVFLLDIVEHLNDRQLEAMFTELKRVLKEDGVMVIHTLPNRWVYNVMYPVVRFFVRSLPVEPRNRHEKEIHINEQSVVSLADHLTRYGLHCRVRLVNLLSAHAEWYRGTTFNDKRDWAYRVLRSWPGRLALSLAGLTPFRLLLFEDIFTVAVKDRRALKRVKLSFVAPYETIARYVLRTGIAQQPVSGG